MRNISRRNIFKTCLAGAAVAPLTFVRSTQAAPATPISNCTRTGLQWGRGIEGQRKADLGNGTFLNPIIAGDHPDPTVLKDGDDYYMTFSSFNSYPGIFPTRATHFYPLLTAMLSQGVTNLAWINSTANSVLRKSPYR